MTYSPQPIDTAHVQLSEELQLLQELLAMHIHEIWAQRRLAEGWTYGPERDDQRRKHPDLVPYEQLSEGEKAYDRQTALETLKLVTTLGYRIEKLPPTTATSAANETGVLTALVDGILTRLRTSEMALPDLLQLYQGDAYTLLWQQDVRLYRTFAKRLIQTGHPGRAFELLHEGLTIHREDATLVYLQALALRRGGNISRALAQVERLLNNQPQLERELRGEALCLLGALYKARYGRATDLFQRVELAASSAQQYATAYQLSASWYSGINAATMFLLADQPQAAHDFATATIALAEQDNTVPEQESHWLHATLGEAHLILGNIAPASSWYRQAVTQAHDKFGDLEAMRGNLQLLRQRLAVGAEIQTMFQLGCPVVAFLGLFQPPALPQSNLCVLDDAALEEQLREQIHTEIQRLSPAVGYCSAASGGDIIFAEQMLARGAELHIVLPCEKTDFYRTCVDFGLPAMARWRQRCDQVLAQAREVHYATTEPFLGDTVLFEFTQTLIQGLTLARASALGETPHALVLASTPDLAAAPSLPLAAQWRAGRYAVRTINWPDVSAMSLPAASPSPLSTKLAPVQARQGSIKRQMKAMLFADVKNFSKLDEEQSPTFFVRFLQTVDEVIQASRYRPVFQNTWGDGLFLVFDRVRDCADFALRFLERLVTMDWQAIGLPADTTVRIGLHAGPVYCQRDPIIGRHNFFGSHVNRAARIEPVTTPGSAFTSEQFAAILFVEPEHDFFCEYIGVEELAKNYARHPLYRLERKESLPREDL